MMPAPLMMLPIVTQSRFHPKPAMVTFAGCSAISAIDSSVILATECSKPLAMKAYRHQKIAMHLAVSLVIRAEVQIAKQTSQLHSIARATSSSAGAFILAAATLIRSWLFAPSANPPPPATKIAASTRQPARLPDQEPIQEAARSRRFVRRRRHPRVMNIVWPVKRSEPAKMTRVNAIPNDDDRPDARIDIRPD